MSVEEARNKRDFLERRLTSDLHYNDVVWPETDVITSSGAIRLVSCPVCRALLLEADRGAHAEWHLECLQ